MRLDDDMIVTALVLLTELAFDEIGKLEGLVKSGQTVNILDAKQRLAFEVTNLYHGPQWALSASRYYQALTSGQLPDEVETYTVPGEWLNQDGVFLIDVLAKTGVIPSKAAGRRMMPQGGIKVNTVEEHDTSRLLTRQELAAGVVVQIGKSRLYKFVTGI